MKEVLKARKAMLESKEKFDEDRKRASRTKRSAAYEEMRKTVVAMQEDVEVSLKDRVDDLNLFKKYSLMRILKYRWRVDTVSIYL